MNGIHMQQIMGKHALERDQLKEDITALKAKYVPLHQLTTNDLHNIIKSWIYNDIKYKKNLQKTMQILSRRALNGAKMSSLSASDLKDIVNNELKQFIKSKTLIVMFTWFDHWMKTDGKSTIKAKTAEELGYMLYNCPLKRLLLRIHDAQDPIDGAKFITYYKEKKQWMEERTGWSKDDVYQIQSVLFRHHTFTSAQIMENITRIPLKDASGASVADTIVKTLIPHFNLETLHYKIKAGQPVPEWSDMVVNMVNDWTHNSEDDPGFIKKIYEQIAGCFACNYKAIESKRWRVSPLDRYQDWTCSNCGNYNFVCTIASVMTHDLSVCTLCGIQQIESIVLLLRGSDTYVLVNSIVDPQNDDEAASNHVDDIDALIESALKTQQFDLKCLDRNANGACPSILRLAKYLIRYKRWIQTVYDKTNGDDTTQNTVKVDISAFVSNDIYRQVFIAAAQKIQKLTPDDVDQIRNIFDNDAHQDNPIREVQTFLKSKRPSFVKLIQRYTKIKMACGLQLYSQIKYALNKQAQTHEFGMECLSDADITIMDEDYHHILHSHINYGTPSTIENVFKFFGYVVHDEDTETQIEMCRSVHRRDQCLDSFKNRAARDAYPKYNNCCKEDKNIWTLKQYYMQSQLDIIHAYLVHPPSDASVAGHTPLEQDSPSSDLQQEMQDKYTTTDLDGSTGVDHWYPNLDPKYVCIRDELVSNTLFSLNSNQFEALLTKAIRTHQIAIRGPYREEFKFICTYFKREFNITRNELIGIRHILAIITYTDVSNFCTAFRMTYRQLSNESNTFQVTTRHRQLYYYARCLYESVEFFGQEMDSQLQVYHGLNKMMKFQEYALSLKQPISTTTSRAQFSEGKGIILTLKSGTHEDEKGSKTPKYLSVSWCSCFPNQDEKLFYGENVKFQIYNITEAQTREGHLSELAMLNKFQKTMQNQEIEWDETDAETQKMIDILEWLVLNQQRMNKNTDKSNIKDGDSDPSTDITCTAYGKELFSYFCNNPSTTSIGIRNYITLPSKLRHALFGSESFISFAPMVNLFRCLTDVTLDELEIGPFTADAVHYFDAVLEYVKQCGSDHQIREVDDLSQIKLYSAPQKDKKNIAALQKLAESYSIEFKKYNWGVHYRSAFTGVHALMFNKHEQVYKGAFNIVKRISKFNLWRAPSYNKYTSAPSPSTKSAEKVFEFPTIHTHTDIWHKTPSLFMQITSVDEDMFHVRLAADAINPQTKRRFRIINIAEPTAVNVPITIYKKKKYARRDVDIEPTHGSTYRLAICEEQNTKDPIANTNQIQFKVLKNADQYPPQNMKYTPHSIDVSTVWKVKDEANDQVNIYWSLPTASVGKISYKIVDTKQNTDAPDTVIPLLPYQIPLSSIPVSFRVITVVHIDNDVYQSEKSKVIRVATDESDSKTPAQAVAEIEQSTTSEAFVKAKAVKEAHTPQGDTNAKDANEDEKKGSGGAADDDNSEEEDDDDDLNDKRELMESFLEMEDIEVNWRMIEYLSRNCELLLSFLSRMPQDVDLSQAETVAVDMKLPLTPIKPLSSDDPTEIKANQLSYNLMRMLANEYDSEAVQSFLSRKCQNIMLHALAVFHPKSSGNVYHARVVLDILLSHTPESFIPALTAEKQIQSLLKCAFFRNLHQGNVNSSILDLMDYTGTADFIGMLVDSKFIPYLLTVACTDVYTDDLVASTYATFFVDLVARCATLPDPEALKLFSGFEQLIVESYVGCLVNEKVPLWQRAACGDTLLKLLDIVSQPTVGDPEPQANGFYAMFPDMLATLHTLIPKLCDAIISSANRNEPIRLNARTVEHPFGRIKLQCFELLTIAADLAEFKCGDALKQIPKYFWSELLDMAFVHKRNNLFLVHFRKLIHLSMLFRRRVLKSLFVNEKLLERFVSFYENKDSSQTSLHAYILLMLWDIYHHDQTEEDGEDIKQEEKEEALATTPQEEEVTNNPMANFSDEPEDEWDIVQYFNSHDIWKRFMVTVSMEMEAQQTPTEEDDNENAQNNQQQLDDLLQNILGPDTLDLDDDY